MVAPVIGMCFCCAERYGTRRSRLHRAGSAGGPALRGTVADHDLETSGILPALLVQPAGLVTVTKSRLAGGRPVS
jgi:hypothetical protein